MTDNDRPRLTAADAILLESVDDDELKAKIAARLAADYADADAEDTAPRRPKPDPNQGRPPARDAGEYSPAALAFANHFGPTINRTAER